MGALHHRAFAIRGRRFAASPAPLPREIIGCENGEPSVPQISTVLLVLVGFLLALPSRADAQACTLGPYTSATSLGSIDSSIDGARDGDVVCLRRGNTWSQTGGAAITLGTGHSDAGRVTICSSDDTQCTDSAGGANAKFAMNNGECFNFSGSADGYNIRHIDCFGANTCDSDAHAPMGYFMPAGTRDVTIVGGVWDNYIVSSYLSTNSTEVVTNFKWGTCQYPIEFRGCESPASHVLHYGHCRNCNFSYWVHNWGESQEAAGTGHVFDLAGWTSTDLWSDNYVIECGRYQINSDNAPGIGNAIKAAQGTDIIVRDNVFQQMGTRRSDYNGLSFNAHTSTIRQGVDGAAVYRNRFLLNNGAVLAVESKLGRNIDIYNNIIDLSGPIVEGSSYATALSIRQESEAPIVAEPDNVRFYNNTIYVSPTARLNTIDVTDGNGHEIYNNLILSTVSNSADGGDGAVVFSTNSCARFGTNGANVHNNVVSTPNDSSPGITNCSAANWLPGSGWNTNPGLVSAAGGDFSLSSTASYAFGRGTATGAPPADFTRATRPNPPSVGAFDIGGAPPAAPDPTPIPDPAPEPTPSPDPDPAPAPDPGPSPPLAPLLLP